MPPSFSRHPIGEMSGCWKYPLPPPLFSRVGIFVLEGVRQSNASDAVLEGVRQSNASDAVLEIVPMLLFGEFEVLGERFFHRPGKQRVPVLIPFACANDNLVTRKIDIFNPQLQTLH